MSESLASAILIVFGVAPVILGPVILYGFEVPETITIGGAQRLAIHRLPGGARVIDALGPDDADIAWSGIASGPEATARIRTLDTLRRGGLPIALAWDANAYTVVVSNFEADTVNPNWIPYRISCAVLSDDTALPLPAAADLPLQLVRPDVAALDAQLAAAAPALYSDDLATSIDAAGSLAHLSRARAGLAS